MATEPKRNWHTAIGQTHCGRCSERDLVCDDCKDAVAERVLNAARSWMLQRRGTGDVDNRCFAELEIAAEYLLELDAYEEANG